MSISDILLQKVCLVFKYLNIFLRCVLYLRNNVFLTEKLLFSIVKDLSKIHNSEHLNTCTKNYFIQNKLFSK